MKEAGSPNPMQGSYCLLSTGLGTEGVEIRQCPWPSDSFSNEPIHKNRVVQS